MSIDTLMNIIVCGIPILISGILIFSPKKSSKKEEINIDITYDQLEDKYFVHKNYTCVACKNTFEEAKKFVDDNREILKQNTKVLYKEKL